MNYMVEAKRKNDGQWISGYCILTKDCDGSDVHIIIPKNTENVMEAIDLNNIVDEKTIKVYIPPANNLSEKMMSYIKKEYGERYAAEYGHEYFMFRTGTNEFGYEFAVNRDNLDSLAGDNPWKAKTVEGIVSICCAKNSHETNEEALELWNLLKAKGLSIEWYEIKEPFEQEGYYWIHYSDGSGSLIGEDGPVINYDTTTVRSGIEYETAQNNWNGWKVYMGSLAKFMARAKYEI